MGQHVAATPGIQHVVEGRRTSCCRRQQPYEGGNFRLSRPTVSRTPRNRQHNSVTEAELLVAKSEEGRRRIRQRVRDVSRNKINTHHQKPHLYPITTDPDAQPFEVVTMDFITKLPTSRGYDSILTITDHDCTKAALFIPCNETV